MKNIFLNICIISSLSSFFLSPEVLAVSPVQKGSNVLAFGLGISKRYYGDIRFSPGVKVNFEHGVWKVGPGVVTLGATFGYTYQRNEYLSGDEYNYKYSNFIFAVRGAWHHNWGVDKLDTYAGASLGGRFSIRKCGDPNIPHGYSVHSHFGGFIGACYYFKPAVGVFAEVGYDINFATIGLNFNF